MCVNYLEIGASPAGLHYLVRRLKQRMPDVPVLVGLWPMDDAYLKDDRIQKVVGADHYTASLREAVETCVRIAHQDVALAPVAAVE